MNTRIRLLHASNCPTPNLVPPICFGYCCNCGGRIKEESVKKLKLN